MKIAIYTLTSSLHDERATEIVSEEFISSFAGAFETEVRGTDWARYGSDEALDLIYVRTGGTEGLFKDLLPRLRRPSGRFLPICLLTSGKSNSLAAAMEILSFLKAQGLRGEIIHGSPAWVKEQINKAGIRHMALRILDGCRLGVVGRPSDWLIASGAEAGALRRELGIELADIPMQELLRNIASAPSQYAPMAQLAGAPDKIRNAYPGAMAIYYALRTIIDEHSLQGLTVRCFDLLSSVGNTGCLALARLGSEGWSAGCEGDIPALVSMHIARALTGASAFQANPSSIDPDSGEIVFAHCTIPFDIVTRFDFDTHYESGIGIGIRGHFQEGPVTLFKLAGDMSRAFIAEGTLIRNQNKSDLCRTQIVVKIDDKALCQSYFLSNPIGNHHIVIPGRHAEALCELLGPKVSL